MGLMAIRQARKFSDETWSSRSFFQIAVAFHVLDTQYPHAPVIEPTPLMHRLDCWLEKLLRDQRRYKRAQDHDTDQNCVLLLVDDFVLQTEQRRDRAKGQSGCH